MQNQIQFMMSSQRFNFGDIVLLSFPFINEKTVKKRPALIIRDTGDEDIIVARITSQLYNNEFDIFIENWKTAGLKLPSVIRLHKIATLDKKLAKVRLGKIDIDLSDRVRKTFIKIPF